MIVKKPGKVQEPGRGAVVLRGNQGSQLNIMIKIWWDSPHLPSHLGQFALVLSPVQLWPARFVVQVDQVVDVVVDDVLVGEISFNLNCCQLPGEIIKPARSHNEGADICLGGEGETLHTMGIVTLVQ